MPGPLSSTSADNTSRCCSPPSVKFGSARVAEDHLPACADRLHRVARNVQERLDHLMPINLDRRQARS
jgi:hypothetical protein